jgi:hypothetical protein
MKWKWNESEDELTPAKPDDPAGVSLAKAKSIALKKMNERLQRVAHIISEVLEATEASLAKTWEIPL